MKKPNTLVYIPSGLQSPELEILLSKSQEIINSNKSNLHIISCLGTKNYACSFNIYSQKLICAACKNRLKNGLKHLRGKYILSETPEIIDDFPLYNKKIFNKILDKKKLIETYYKNIDVGISSYSSYLSISRDMELEGFLADKSLKKILICTIVLSDFFFRYLKEKNIKEIFIYNGRQSQNRVLFRIAKIFKIRLTVLEHTTIFKNSNGVRNFEDNLPNDINFFTNKIKNHISKFSEAKKKLNISNYFKFKQMGLVINDKISYIKKQQSQYLPKKWDPQKKNIVFFTSSEDEYAALGGEYNNLIYKNQSDALLKIINVFKNKKNEEYQLWIRMHPNLNKVKWNFNTRIIKLENLYSNIHVIKPLSKASTYKMMVSSDKVLAFYSTTAIEAAYLKKPTILLGRQYFERLGFCYIPKDHNEVIKLIFDSNLKAKNPSGASKLALYWIEKGFKQKFFWGNHVDGYKFNNKTIDYSFLYKLIFYFGKLFSYYFYQSLNFYLRSFKKRSSLI